MPFPPKSNIHRLHPARGFFRPTSSAQQRKAWASRDSALPRPSTYRNAARFMALHCLPSGGQPRSSRVETNGWQKSVSGSPPPNTGNRAGPNLVPHLLGDATRAPAGRAGLRCLGGGAALPGARPHCPGAGLQLREWQVLLFDWRAAGNRDNGTSHSIS